MSDHRSYGQFCALARALDRVGDRWTLLVVRELLFGDRTVADLRRALPNVSPNLLQSRLQSLIGDGLVVRNEAPGRSRFVRYHLTDAGAELVPVVFELMRWGARFMGAGPGDDHIEAQWAVLIVKTRLDGVRASTDEVGAVHLDVDGHRATVVADGSRLSVTLGRHGHADATVRCSMWDVVGLIMGSRDLTPFEIGGDDRLAREILGAMVGERADDPLVGSWSPMVR